jgi:2-dehydro-3-deoxy-D-arabinonate dehydratase
MYLHKSINETFLQIRNVWYEKLNINWNKLLAKNDLHAYLMNDLSTWTVLTKKPIFKPQVPIGNQEVWAAGVTYLKSKLEREKESEDAASFYDKVYSAKRPELFFKSASSRVSGHLDKVFIRKDSTWNVPEPELTLLCSAKGSIEGYTIGNDMSSRSIEGENPLYLPQAKTYDHSAALGPCIYIPNKPISQDTQISMTIFRKGDEVCSDNVSISQMKRTHKELVSWLFKEISFPNGCFLMTGTCLVPEEGFTLLPEDIVRIEIDNIGVLKNIVSYRP